MIKNIITMANVKRNQTMAKAMNFIAEKACKSAEKHYKKAIKDVEKATVYFAK